MKPHDWLLFVSHLPGKESAARMRVWRGLRGAGAAILRDGVYLLPESDEARRLLRLHVSTVHDAGGSAHVLESRPTDASGARAFRELFDRSEEYAGWHREAASFVSHLPRLEEPQARRTEAALRRALEAIVDMDYFPGAARDTARRVMDELVASVNARFSPDEPTAVAGDVPLRDPGRYRGRLWATRRGLWIDRVASAWLIRRFIDCDARFHWLESTDGLPDHAVGFDFDGAEFTHVGAKVTFEVLLRAFALESDPALARLGVLIHYLDIGGEPVAEAPGVVAVLSGARERCPADDLFLDEASRLFDDLYTSFTTPPGSARP